MSVVLCCSVCGGRNYKTTRSGRPDEPRLSLRKYCKACSAHILHRESL